MKKLALMFSTLILITSPLLARAQSSSKSAPREFTVSFKLATGETKSLVLRAGPDLTAIAHGDPEIPSHGFYDYEIQGSVIEDGKSCPFSLLLFQEDGPLLNTEQGLAEGRDRPGSIQTCSGLRLDLASVRALLLEGESQALLSAPGLRVPLSKSTLKFSRRYEEPRANNGDPWHCPPDFTGPCH